VVPVYSGAGAEDESLRGTLSEGGSEASGSASLPGHAVGRRRQTPWGVLCPYGKPAAALPVWLEDATHNEFVVRARGTENESEGSARGTQHEFVVEARGTLTEFVAPGKGTHMELVERARGHAGIPQIEPPLLQCLSAVLS